MKRDSCITIVDAHVHLRSCFEVIPLLEGACSNFAAMARRFCDSGQFVGVLCLSTTPHERRFSWLLDLLSEKQVQNGALVREMTLVETQESTSFSLVSNAGNILVVVAGRQITSSEGLEVLAVGTCEQFKERERMGELIQDITQAGALPVIPWGVGKWLGERGQLVNELIRSSQLPQFFLGDNANRPVFWPQPSHFRQAEKRGIRNLPGSDPLPFPGEVQRVGSYGFALRGSLDKEKPAHDLKERLHDPSTTICHFGRRERPFRFFYNQIRMQYRKLT